MRKDSTAIFGMSLLITVVLIGAAYYFNEIFVNRAETEASPAHPNNVNRPATGNQVAVQPKSATWTDKPIKCFDELIGEFWTNAKDCESADLKNRLSYAQPHSNVGQAKSTAGASQNKPSPPSAKIHANEPNLRKVARSVPNDLNVGCKFSVGRALEVERDLSAADDPAESVWRENYCKWVNEARSHRCAISADFFYYERLCGYGFRSAN